MLPAKTAMDILSTNLQLQMDKRNWSENELGRRSKIDPKTINNIVNRRTAATVDSLDAIAGAFGVRVWRLLLEDVGQGEGNNGDLERLIEGYTKTDETGKNTILTVADIAARPYRE